MRDYKTRVMIITILVLTLLILPSYTLAISIEEYEGPPIDLSIWPDMEYVLEIDSDIIGEGVVHRQYYSKHLIYSESITETETYVVIFRFKENGVDQTILLSDEKQYMKNSISYGEFFETNDSYGNLITRTLPGEEMAMPGYEKLGEVE
ncbi:MAG: hypothetical protein ACLFUI_09725, partial [Halanaerobiales bacterium]